MSRLPKNEGVIKMTEKIDEALYYKHVTEYIKMMSEHEGIYHPGNPEEEQLVKRKADTDFAIIYLMDTVFYDGTHHFKDRIFINENLRQYRPDLTDEEITDSLERCVTKQRLVVRNFKNDRTGIWILKWVFNDNYTQGIPKPTCRIIDPLESEEFRKKFEKIAKL